MNWWDGSGGNHYMELLYNKRKPLFNRAVSGRYPPGSTFKLVQGLIGMQEGVLAPSMRYPCHEGYQVGRLKMKCHAHASPADLRFAIATSCNGLFLLRVPQYSRKSPVRKRQGGFRRVEGVCREFRFRP